MDEAIRQYKVIFQGQLLPGNNLDEVKARAEKVLKLSAPASNRLFNSQGKSMVIKTANSLEDANAYCNKLNRLGMMLTIQEHQIKQANDIEVAAEFKAENNQAKPQPLTLEKKALSEREIESIAQMLAKTNSSDSNQFVKKYADTNGVLFFLRLPILLILMGLTFCVLYLPYPDGFLRKGFILGTIILIFGLRRLRNQLL